MKNNFNVEMQRELLERPTKGGEKENNLWIVYNFQTQNREEPGTLLVFD